MRLRVYKITYTGINGITGIGAAGGGYLQITVLISSSSSSSV